MFAKRLFKPMEVYEGVGMMKKQIKQRPSKWIRYILVISACILGATQLGWMYQNDASYVSVQVQEGDTVWHLASLASDNSTDVRQTVDAIMTRNHLSSNADIRPGQTIEIPVNKENMQQIQHAVAQRP